MMQPCFTTQQHPIQINSRMYTFESHPTLNFINQEKQNEC